MGTAYTSYWGQASQYQGQASQDREQAGDRLSEWGHELLGTGKPVSGTGWGSCCKILVWIIIFQPIIDGLIKVCVYLNEYL